MINLHKFSTGLLTGLILVSLVGCSDDTKVITKDSTSASETVDAGTDNANADSTTVAEEQVSNISSKLVFNYNGVDMWADQNVNDVISKIEDEPSYFEEPSCAADGLSKYYTYTDFEIITYPDGDNDMIGYISLNTDNVATPEGIDLSKTKDDVIVAYGDNYTEVPGGITYFDGTTSLSFFFDEDGNVRAIRYASTMM